METINCFGHQLVLEHCNHRDYYDNPDVASAVERIFSLPEIHNRERGANWDSHHGEGATSEVNPYLGPEHISGAKELIHWIKEQCLRALKLYNIDGTSIEITRSWMNQMNYKSQGRCHQHTGINQENYQPIKMNYGDSPTTYSYDLVETPDLVAIFYVSNQPNGSSLVVVKDGVFGQLPSDMEESNKYYILPKSGDLIIHQPEVWHGVSEHNSQTPRVCFAFHIKAK